MEKMFFIFEMANNHGGDLEHGKKIVKEIKKVCNEFGFEFEFGFKLQYRELDTFIHKDFHNSQENKLIKRFSETKLTSEEFVELKNEIVLNGFTSICTPFDEYSVENINAHGFDIFKIASCSFTDWPLLEKIAQFNKPIIASTAGASFKEINNVVWFFKHRKKDISLMHCIAEYPCQQENYQLNQIDILSERYRDLKIGFSTHESPEERDSIKMAIAKGAVIFERHVGIETETIKLNHYSSNPEQIYNWLEAARLAVKMCGITDGKRYSISIKESDSLRALRRGAYAKTYISKGERIDTSKLYYAIPNIDNQLIANDISKYKEFYATNEIKANEPLLFNNISVVDTREKVEAIVKRIKEMLKNKNINLPNKLRFELSHHYGIDSFNEIGVTIIDCVNREYCKKILVILPGQKHPAHHHKIKEETFHILHGDLTMVLDEKVYEYKEGDMVLVERAVNHSFSSKNGAVLEEISTTHYKNDSYYKDKLIQSTEKRKTELTFWTEDYFLNE